MVIHQSVHGAGLNFSYRHTQRIGGFLEFVGKAVGQRAYEMYRQPGLVVVDDVAGKEFRETLDYHLVNLGYGAFLIYERRETGNEPVGQWLAVNALNDALFGK